MATTALPFEIPDPVARNVSRLRLLVRLYSLAEGVTALAIVAGVSFWAGLAIDWILEPPPAVRVAMWEAVVAAGAFTAWKYIGRRLFARLPADSLALLVERQHPQLKEGLVTTVQAGITYASSPDQAWSGLSGHEFNRALIDATGRRAASAMDEVRLSRVFNMRPLTQKASTALLLLISIAAFALVEREAFAFWIDRMQLSDQLWPRRVHLTVEGFEEREASPVVNVARDDDFELNVFASIIDGYSAPDEVEVRWRRLSDGGRGGGPMLKIGEAVSGRDEAQQYRYTFKASSDLEFDVIGGDDRIRHLRLRAVERPSITRVWLEVQYPAYMRREPQSVPVSGRAELPEGAAAVCRIEANKPLKSVGIRDAAEQIDVPAPSSRRSNSALRLTALRRIASSRSACSTLMACRIAIHSACRFR
jgi:hypothetical protein